MNRHGVADYDKRRSPSCVSMEERRRRFKKKPALVKSRVPSFFGLNCFSRNDMAKQSRFYLTTAIDYPNSRPHIGTAFEKLGADVQARYRRMEGYDVFFLMGNDENTVKVAKAAVKLGQDVQTYCDEMARQFRSVWNALEITYDTF